MSTWEGSPSNSPVLRERSEIREQNGFLGHDLGHIVEGHLVGEVVGGLDFDDEPLDGGEVGDERAVSSQLHRPRRLITNIRLAQPIGTVLNRHVVRHG